MSKEFKVEKLNHKELQALKGGSLIQLIVDIVIKGRRLPRPAA